jgi:phosphoribosylformylglycinamidine cyclo-ligase
LLKGAAHITGGGITDNTPRILPPGLAAQIDAASWKIPAVFELLRELGRVTEDDFRRTFNLGIGMILAIPPRKLSQAKKALDKLDEPYYEIGRVIRLPRGAKSRVIYV